MSHPKYFVKNISSILLKFKVPLQFIATTTVIDKSERISSIFAIIYSNKDLTYYNIS
jgi:hypothetical protein